MAPRTPAQAPRAPQSARDGDVSSGSTSATRKEIATTEYVSGKLGGKIKAIICEWSKRVKEGTEPAEYLESSAIYERLISEGVEVPDHAMSEILVELAQGGQIKLTMDTRPSRDPRKYGSMTIRSVRPELCS
jgi:hypothetical protein